MSSYLIGIDNGSQSTKVTILDERGRVAATGRVPLRPSVQPRPGAVEHPDDDLWHSTATATRLALDAFTGDRAEIAGVGLCTIRFCRAMLRADGSLAHPMLSWMDPRVNRPYVPETDDTAYVTASSGYIAHRLTGEFTDTAANYRGTWPLDTDTWRWSSGPEAYAATGVDRDMLFDLVDPGQELGRVTAQAAAATGLPEGLPVVATANDKAVEALGSGLRDPSTLLISLGTYIAGMAVGDRNRPATRAVWANFGAEPGRYLYESRGIRRGMATVSWFRDLLGAEAAESAAAAGESVEDLLGREAAGVPAGSRGLLTVLDWLAAPDAPHRRGTIVGFDGSHSRAHVYRSILESIAMTMRDHVDAMADELGTRFERVAVSGGGAASDLMMQIVADAFQRPAIRVAGDSAAGRGAAICAAVGTGVHPTFEAATDAMVPAGERFDFDRGAAEVYERLRPILRDISTATDPIYRRLDEVST